MNLIKEFMENPLFSIGLSVMIFELFSLINKKTKVPLRAPFHDIHSIKFSLIFQCFFSFAEFAFYDIL